MTPTVGRVVLFKTRLASLKHGQSALPIATHPAIVTFVWNPQKVNLQVLPDSSTPFPKSAITNDPTQHNYWEWPVEGESIQDAR